MKIKQEKDIKKFLDNEFGEAKGSEIFSFQDKILDGLIKNIQDKSENQRKTLMQTILPRIALFKAMQKTYLSEDEVYQHIKKYMMDIVATKKHASMVKMEKIPGFYTLYRKIFLQVVKKTDLLESMQESGKDYFDVTMKKCLWHTACKENDCPHLCRFFCDVDNVTYGNLKKWVFHALKL